MPFNGLLDNPDHWRKRADEARAHADQLSDLVARAAMLDIATSYDKLAQRAERRTTPDFPPAATQSSVAG